MSDTESDTGYASRSSSRRARRRRTKASASAQTAMPAVQEDPQQQQQVQAQLAEQKRQQDLSTMQAFDWIGPDSTSMNGPVTKARAERGEIPPRPGNPNQSLATGVGEHKGSSLDDQDGLKLKLELNLDVELEIKASIRGDLTLALLA